MGALLKDSKAFSLFIKPETDRNLFIQNWLTGNNINFTEIKLQEKKHILIRFPQPQYNPMFKIKTVIAHYDRVSDTEGANDNSFAVFVLMNWAKKLSQSSYAHNIRIIFTDGEESEKGLNSQGAFHLAGLLQKLNITKDEVFVFDCMGRGNIPVLCDINVPSGASESFKKEYAKLEGEATKLMDKSTAHWLTLPTSYSDNAGFIARGIPAVTITMLPSKEAENYLSLLLKTKAKSIEELNRMNFNADEKKLYPETWNLINSSQDKKETLTDESQGIFEKILENLAALRTMSL